MWKKFAIAVGALIALLVCFAVASAFLFENRTQETGDSYYNELNKLARDVSLGYNQPVNEAAKSAGCNRSSAAGSPDCAALIGAFVDTEPALEAGIARLESLLEQRPPSVDETVMTKWRDIAIAMRATRDSNQLLVQSWASADQDKWSEGWALREFAANQLSGD